MRTRFLLACAPALALLTALACGDDDSPPPPTAGGSGSSGSAGGAGASGAAGAAPYKGNCLAPPRPQRSVAIALQPAFDALSFERPLLLLQAPGDGSRTFVVEQGGRVFVFASDDGVKEAATFVDLSKRVDDSASEAGLLGMAFHPKFAQNGQVFLSYTISAQTPSGLRSIIARYTSNDGGKTLDPGSEQVVLQLDQPYGNHNGGMIAFGPDGLLYIGFGDGGAGGDPLGSGQDVNSLLGKILRIDVDGPAPYGIPQDNPFAKGGGKPEIFAWGVRNPWRFSFDRATGELWAGDVGQNAYEEVDKIKLGGNYGWNTMEGFHCYQPAENCNQAGLALPEVEYPRSDGASITGGYVYHGKAIPALQGSYLYGDFSSGRLWRVVSDPETGGSKPELLLETGVPIASFGEAVDGEVFVVGYGPGKIYRITASAQAPGGPFPQRLSETGCFDPSDLSRPAQSLIPYEINAPFWSDGADKKRWFSLPPGGTLAVGPDRDLDLPKGSVVVKEFTLGGKRIETRLFVRHDDGGWAGYTYEWDDAQKDATLLTAAKKKKIGAQTWHYPSGAECMQCHTAAAGRTLGLELAQLDRQITLPDGSQVPQIARLVSLGLLVDDLPAGPPLADPLGDGPLAARARSYLHTNCSFCHRPGGPGRGDLDFRFSTPLASVKVCNATPQQGDLGIAGAKLLTPGSPGASVLSSRLHRRDAAGMPPLASTLVDEQGAAVVDAWIKGLTGCLLPATGPTHERSPHLTVIIDGAAAACWHEGCPAPRGWFLLEAAEQALGKPER